MNKLCFVFGILFSWFHGNRCLRTAEFPLNPCSGGANVYDLLRDNRNSFIMRDHDGTTLKLHDQAIRLVGANIYWVGLGENGGPEHNEVNHPTEFRLDDAIETAYNVMGFTVIRTHTAGINLGHPISFHPTLTLYNHSALYSADYMLSKARQLGMRVVIPLTDFWDFYHGGRYTFARWRNKNPIDFWTDPQIRIDWHDYINQLLNHVNPLTNTKWKDDPTIVAFETGNELKHPPIEWTNDTCKFIKSIAPNHLVMSGTFGPNPLEFGLECVDILSNHYYHWDMQHLDVLQKDYFETTETGKKIFCSGEYGWPDCKLSQLKAFLVDIEQSPTAMNIMWSIFPHDDDFGFRQHHDGYSFYYPGLGDNTQERMIYMREHAYCLAQAYPSVEFLSIGVPKITSIDENGLICWRGAYGAAMYKLYRATASSDFALLADGLSDFDPCFTDPPQNTCYKYKVEAWTFNNVTASRSLAASNTFC